VERLPLGRQSSARPSPTWLRAVLEQRKCPPLIFLGESGVAF
jgi:hypothetical protein